MSYKEASDKHMLSCRLQMEAVDLACPKVRNLLLRNNNTVHLGF